MLKWTKRIILSGVLVVGIGALLFGTGLGSYLRSSGRMLKRAVDNSIPVEFEIQRARDLIADLIPEMQANLRLVAAEEVEVANLEKEIKGQQESVRTESDKLHGLRNTLNTQMVSYSVGGREYQRSELVDELARRFERLRTSDMILKGKQEVLKNRRRSLEAALQKLEKTRVARFELDAQIAALEAKNHIIQAQSSGSEFRINESKLAETNKVIADLKKRLEVAERVLAREAKFVEMIPEETVSESTVLDRVDAYFGKKPSVPAGTQDVASTSPATESK